MAITIAVTSTRPHCSGKTTGRRGASVRRRRRRHTPPRVRHTPSVRDAFWPVLLVVVIVDGHQAADDDDDEEDGPEGVTHAWSVTYPGRRVATPAPTDARPAAPGRLPGAVGPRAGDGDRDRHGRRVRGRRPEVDR